MLAQERLLRQTRGELNELGLAASISVRRMAGGEGIALDADRLFPLASVVKLPLAIAVLRAADRSAGVELDEPVDVDPARTTSGPTGLSRFRDPARISVQDLLYLAVCVSDNAAADLLFGLCPPRVVTDTMRELDQPEITVRHPISDMLNSLMERLGPDDQHLALSLAARAATGEGGSLVPQLDLASANTGSARGLADLLCTVWGSDEPWALRTRELLGGQLIRHRLAPELETDAARWSSKTGTFLTLRHEVGVLEHDDGDAFAIAVLSESRIPALVQPLAEMALGRAARALHDFMRR